MQAPRPVLLGVNVTQEVRHLAPDEVQGILEPQLPVQHPSPPDIPPRNVRRIEDVDDFAIEPIVRRRRVSPERNIVAYSVYILRQRINGVINLYFLIISLSSF